MFITKLIRSSTLIKSSTILPTKPLSQNARFFSILSSRLAPSKKYYTQNHEWVQLVKEGEPLAKVGITDYAADKLGDLSYTSLDELKLDDEEVLDQGDDLIDIESVKASDTVKMPVSGQITSINKDLLDNAVIVNRSPEEEGWLVEVKVSNLSEVEALMDKEAYESYCQEE